jgi:tetratricopeptide (TPR) repeat protein
MAKQRRSQTRTARHPTESASARSEPDAFQVAQERALPSPSPSTGPQRRSTYFEAVALYERGLEALQRHDYRRAKDLLEGVLRQYPEEKELHERVRLYLNICQRQVTTRETTPQTVDERLYAATLAINGGQYDQAIAHLRLVRDEDPDNDYALYMLAVAHAQRDELAEAVAHLERAIALNHENRGLARTDPDLEPLHEDEAFRTAVEAPAPSRSVDGKRRPVRTKAAR